MCLFFIGKYDPRKDSAFRCPRFFLPLVEQPLSLFGRVVSLLSGFSCGELLSLLPVRTLFSEKDAQRFQSHSYDTSFFFCTPDPSYEDVSLPKSSPPLVKDDC